MKQIIKIEMKACKADFTKCRTDLLAVGIFSDKDRFEKMLKQVEKLAGGAVSNVKKLGDFQGKANTFAVLYGDAKAAAKRILLVGLGEAKKVEVDVIRNAAAVAGSKAVELKAKNTVAAIHQGLDNEVYIEKTGQVIAEGLHYGSYRYDEYMTQEQNGRPKMISFEIVESQEGKLKLLEKGMRIGQIIGQAQSFTRTIANRPANVINPQAIAMVAKEVAKEGGLGCIVMDEKQLKQKKMEAILAVGKGSVSSPRLIVLKYQPKGKKAKKTVAIVGKAITFDSGGISLKPGEGMDEMKFDKSGGIAVIGTMKAIAALKPAINVFGIIPSAENLPSGSSYRPGDIVTTSSGKTVEVLNTDAEGRMILSDALNYAVKQGCEEIVDIATLTGACVIALGKHMAGLMGNDDGLIEELKKAAKESGEKVWHLPSGEEYVEEMKSKIADLRNVATKWGGACTGAAFLSQFVGDKKWAHLDIAGLGMNAEYKNLGCVGSKGFGVRLLTTYLLNAAKR